NTLQAVTDSIIASAIDTGTAVKTKYLLQQLARALKGINDLKESRTLTRQSVQLFKIVLPEGIFPLPLVGSDLKDHRSEQIKKRKEIEAKLLKQKEELMKEIEDSNKAISDLMNGFDT